MPKFTPPANATPVQPAFTPPADAEVVKKKDDSVLSSSDTDTAVSQGQLSHAQSLGAVAASSSSTPPSNPTQAYSGLNRVQPVKTQDLYTDQDFYNLLYNISPMRSPQKITSVTPTIVPKAMSASGAAALFGEQDDPLAKMILQKKDQQKISDQQKSDAYFDWQQQKKAQALSAEATSQIPQTFAQASQQVTLPTSTMQDARDAYTNYLQTYKPDDLSYHQQGIAASKAEGDDLTLQKKQADFDMASFNYLGSQISSQRNDAATAISKNYSSQYNQIKDINAQQQKMDADYQKMTAVLNNYPKDHNGAPVIPQDDQVGQSTLQGLKDVVQNYQNFQAQKDQLLQDPGFAYALTAVDENDKKLNDINTTAKDWVKNNYPVYEDALDRVKTAQQVGLAEHSLSTQVINPLVGVGTSFLKDLAYLPKMVAGDGTYGMSDEFYDRASNWDQYTATPWFPTALTQDENGNITPTGIAKLTQGAGNLALMFVPAIGVEGQATKTALNMGMAVATTAGSAYDSAKAAGMGEREAQNYSLVMSGVNMALMAAIPDFAGKSGTMFKRGAQSYMDILAKGGSSDAARKAAMKVVGGEIAQMGAFNVANKLSEYGINYAANNITGSNLDTGKNIGSDMMDAVVSAVIAGTVVGGIKTGQAKGYLQDEALFMAAHDPQRYKDALMDMSQKGILDADKMAQITGRIDQASQALSGMKDDLTPEQKMASLPLVMQNMDLAAKQKTAIPVFKDQIQQQINDNDNQIKKVAGIVTLPEEGEEPQPLTDDEQHQMEGLQAMRDMDAITDDERKKLNDLQTKQDQYTAMLKAAEKGTESATQKPQQDATQIRQQQESDQLQHQNGDESRTLTETGNRNSDVQSGQEPQEEVITLRHGETEEDAQNKNSGHTPAPLTDEGKNEAKQKGQQLKDEGVKTIITSPIERAKETADIAAKEADAKVVVDNDLATWDIGKFANQDEKKFDEADYVNNPSKVVEGGESFNDFRERMQKAYEKIKSLPNDTAVISHSRNNRMFDALEKNDGQWTDRTKEDYLDSKATDDVRVGKEAVESLDEQSQPLTDNADVVSRLRQDIATMRVRPEKGKALSDESLRTKFKAVVGRINEAVKNGMLTKETAKEFVDAAKRARKQRISDPIDEATEKIITALKALHLAGGDEGIVRQGWGLDDLVKFGGEIAKRLIDKGMDIDMAVGKAIDAIKNHSAFKAIFTDEAKGNQALEKMRQEFSDTLNPEKQKEVQESPLMETEQGRTRMFSAAKRLMESSFVNEKIKEGISSQGLSYLTGVRDLVTSDAKKIVDYFSDRGQHEALFNLLMNPKDYANTSGDLKEILTKKWLFGQGTTGMDPLTRGTLAIELAGRMGDISEKSEDQDEKDRNNAMAAQMYTLAKEMMASGGRLSAVMGQMLKDQVGRTEEGMIGMADQQANLQATKITEGQKGKVSRTAEEFRAGIEEEKERVIKQRAKKTLTPEQKAAAKERRKSMYDILPAKKPGAVKEKIQVTPKQKEVLTGILSDIINSGSENPIGDFMEEYKSIKKKNPPKELMEVLMGETVNGEKVSDILPHKEVLKLINSRFDELSYTAKAKLVATTAQELNTNGTISNEKFGELYTQAMKGDILPDDMIEQMKVNRKVWMDADEKEKTVKGLVTGYVDAENGYKQKNQKMSSSERKDWETKIQKANVEWKRSVLKGDVAWQDNQNVFKEPSIWSALSAGMRGNLMSTATVSKIGATAIIMSPLRYATRLIPTLGESLWNATMGNIVKSWHMERSTDVFAQTRGAIKYGIPFALREAYRDLRYGHPAKVGDVDFRPGMTLRDAAEGALKGKRKGEQHFIERKLVEAYSLSMGAPAQIMNRLVAIPHSFLKNLGSIGRAYEIAHNKGLRGSELTQATLFPDESDMKAIEKEGLRTSYLQKNIVSNVLGADAKFLNDLSQRGEVGRHLAGLIRFLKTGAFTFTQVPTNIFSEALHFTSPSIGIFSGVVDTGRSVAAGKEGNKSAALDYRRSAEINFSKTVIAIGIAEIAKNWIQNGVMTPGYNKEDKPGEKAAAFAFTRPNSINWSALQRQLSGDPDWAKPKVNDTWVNYGVAGSLGIVLGTWAEVYKDQSRQQIEDSNAAAGSFYNWVGGAGKAFADMPYLKTQNEIMNLIYHPESSKYFFGSYLTTLSSTFIPATVSNISKASQDYLADTHGNTAGEIMYNNFANSYFMGGSLPSKVTIWGEPVSSAPKGYNSYAWYLLNPAKPFTPGNDNPYFTFKMFDCFVQMNDPDLKNKFWPKQPKNIININHQDVQLNPQEYEDYQKLVGTQRSTEVNAYVMHGDFDGQDDDTRVKVLNNIYQAAQVRAKMMLIQDKPRLMKIAMGASE